MANPFEMDILDSLYESTCKYHYEEQQWVSHSSSVFCDHQQKAKDSVVAYEDDIYLNIIYIKIMFPHHTTHCCIERYLC